VSIAGSGSLRVSWILPIILIVLLSSSSLAQVVKLKLIDASGHAVPNRAVSITLVYDGAAPSGSEPTILRSETDGKGEAQFTLPKAFPTQLRAWVDLTSSEHWWCVCSALIGTREVVEKGYVSANPGPGAGSGSSSRKPVPGEILFVARRWNLFERMIAPLERG
jgi:hypothetical protein